MSTTTPGRLAITWLGHSTFVITTSGGTRIVTDPWLDGNPSCPPGTRIDAADLILLTHGHADHSGDIIAVARATGAPVVAIFELAVWLQGKGLQNVKG
jgi:L-ascorbate metabolism protein UlaG (beta-lactamase superfamily)